MSKFCSQTSPSFTCSFWGVCSAQERSCQVCLDPPHLLNVRTESFSYFWIPVTGTAPHLKTVTGRFMVLGCCVLSWKSLTELDINSVIWPDWKAELLFSNLYICISWDWLKNENKPKPKPGEELKLQEFKYMPRSIESNKSILDFMSPYNVEASIFTQQQGGLEMHCPFICSYETFTLRLFNKHL